MRAIRFVVVDDSTFVRKALCRILEHEDSINVVGSAASGEELLENLGKWRPEVVTLDLNMPGIGGLATLDRVLRWKPIPVIILSTHSAKDAPLTIEALHHGAVDFIDKQQYSLVDFDSLRKVLVEKILHVVGKAESIQASLPISVKPSVVRTRHSSPVSMAASDFNVVLIGASTGGPPAIQEILEGLSIPLPVPFVVVQHMPEGFTEAFANRLDDRLPFGVREAADGEVLRTGTVYIARAGLHLLLDLEGDRLAAVRSRFPSTAAHCPSIDVLFQSAARICNDDFRVLGILLTGMGKDGALGLKDLADHGALTLAQDEASSVIYGMPGAAKELGAVREELPLPTIARRINQLLSL